MAISVNSKELIQLLELTPADQNIMLPESTELASRKFSLNISLQKG